MKTTGKASAAMIARAKRTVLGRLLCRLAGDQAGGVMVEYVILAVLVAAAAVVAVMFLGRGLVTGLSGTTAALAGDSAGATAMSAKAKGEATAAQTQNEEYRRTHADR